MMVALRAQVPQTVVSGMPKGAYRFYNGTNLSSAGRFEVHQTHGAWRKNVEAQSASSRPSVPLICLRSCCCREGTKTDEMLFMVRWNPWMQEKSNGRTVFDHSTSLRFIRWRCHIISSISQTDASSGA
jgi:hypothetical protein